MVQRNLPLPADVDPLWIRLAARESVRVSHNPVPLDVVASTKAEDCCKITVKAVAIDSELLRRNDDLL